MTGVSYLSRRVWRETQSKVGWGRNGVQLKFALLTVLVLLMCVASSPSHSAPPIPACTSGTSSVAYGEEPVTIWYPPGCAHP